MQGKGGELKNTLVNIKKLGPAESESETFSYSQSLQIANESHIKQRPVTECRGCLKRLVGSASGGWGGSEAHTQRPSKVKSRHGCRGDNFGSSAMTASGSGRPRKPGNWPTTHMKSINTTTTTAARSAGLRVT